MKRTTGKIVHVGSSRSAKYWAIAKNATGEPFFLYGANFLNAPSAPHIGTPVEFTALPPSPAGKLKRGTEIWCLASISKSRIDVTRHKNTLTTVLTDGKTRRILNTLTL